MSHDSETLTIALAVIAVIFDVLIARAMWIGQLNDDPYTFVRIIRLEQICATARAVVRFEVRRWGFRP